MREIQERDELLDKKYTTGLTGDEEIRLSHLQEVIDKETTKDITLAITPEMSKEIDKGLREGRELIKKIDERLRGELTIMKKPPGTEVPKCIGLADNEPSDTHPFKAPVGKLRVTGFDSFDGTDWFDKDFDNLSDAKEYIEEKTKGENMLIYYVWDNAGNCLAESGEF